ncbi:MAG: HEAT repeat domain-containing protein [Phycisphaerae bacterium]|jgi:HEAT repeat protein|nr:HEAT repeat domain-containing protein [Phycisphaerae bacterium]
MRPIQIAGLVALAVLLGAVAVVYWPDSGDPDSPDPDKRLQAITELSGQADAEAVKTLVRLTRDSEPRVAIAAVKAIGAAPKTSHAPLQRILARPDNSPPVRAEAVAALGKCPKKNVPVTVLTKVLKSDPDPQVRAGAARGLARRRDKVAIGELVEALEDPDARVRLWAVTAIGRTTALRFDYDAWTEPEKQQKKIRIIKETLRLRTDYK